MIVLSRKYDTRVSFARKNCYYARAISVPSGLESICKSTEVGR